MASLIVDSGKGRSSQYMGRIELQEDLTNLARQLRIQRLREVREQERQISAVKCLTYRSKIIECKEVKYENSRRKKVEKLSKQAENLMVKWQCSLVQTGDAHRNARIHSEKAYDKKSSQQRHAKKYQVIAESRMERALKIERYRQMQRQKKDEELQALKQIRDQERISERDDAHTMREALESRQKFTATLEKDLTLSNVNQKIARSAEQVHHRFPTMITAKVIRHQDPGNGIVDNHGDSGDAKVAIVNEAAEQERQTIRHTWTNILSEMKRKKVVKKRAEIARIKNMKMAGAEYLEEELRYLQQVDIAAPRNARVKESTNVKPEAEDPNLQIKFEREFMSTVFPYETWDGKDDQKKTDVVNAGASNRRPEKEIDYAKERLDEYEKGISTYDEDVLPEPPAYIPRPQPISFFVDFDKLQNLEEEPLSPSTYSMASTDSLDDSVEYAEPLDVPDIRASYGKMSVSTAMDDVTQPPSRAIRPTAVPIMIPTTTRLDQGLTDDEVESPDNSRIIISSSQHDTQSTSAPATRTFTFEQQSDKLVSLNHTPR